MGVLAGRRGEEVSVQVNERFAVEGLTRLTGHGGLTVECRRIHRVRRLDVDGVFSGRDGRRFEQIPVQGNQSLAVGVHVRHSEPLLSPAPAATS
ncbi:hypothetical protein ACWCQK_28005 [Streptomyces sp. NPDC002306]